MIFFLDANNLHNDLFKMPPKHIESLKHLEMSLVDFTAPQNFMTFLYDFIAARQFKLTKLSISMFGVTSISDLVHNLFRLGVRFDTVQHFGDLLSVS